MVFNTILRLYMARIKQTGNKLMAHCWACSQITSEYIIVFLVKSNRIGTYIPFLCNIHEYCSNKSFSNVVMQVTSFSKLDSTYDVGDATEQPDLCYHQCTRCAIIFQCRKIKLYSISFERCTKPFFYGKCNICNQ